MNERKTLGRELELVAQELRELEISYEQYFAGVEKREPILARETLARRMRHLASRRIIQTDLRFRYQNLATRFHTYSSYWDRILRQMDEGRFTRKNLCRYPPPQPPSAAAAPPKTPSEVDHVYRQLLEAHQRSTSGSAPPGREQVEAFLEKQKQAIKEKFGEREIEFLVDMASGKPRIKVRPKR